jgi:hypothetical protein
VKYALQLPLAEYRVPGRHRRLTAVLFRSVRQTVPCLYLRKITCQKIEVTPFYGFDIQNIS